LPNLLQKIYPIFRKKQKEKQEKNCLGIGGHFFNDINELKKQIERDIKESMKI